MDKEATVVARNLRDFTKAVNRLPKQTGHKLGKKSRDIVNSAVNGQGTGSFLIDFFGGGLKKKPAVSKKINKIQRGAVDLDMRAGAKVHDFLRKGLDKKEKMNKFDKFRNGLSNQFVKEYNVKMAPSTNGVADINSKIKTTSLLNPVDKVKDKALPIIGGMAVADKLMPQQNANTGGDIMANQPFNEREDLKNKIAASLGIGVQNNEKVASTKDAELLKYASDLLSGAANEIEVLRNQVEKLALENRELELREIRRAREEEGLKIANEMYEKGLIKKADIEKKSSEIALMENDSLALFKEALEGVEAPVEEGVDKLTFIIEEDNIEKRGNLADSVIDSAKKIQR